MVSQRCKYLVLAIPSRAVSIIGKDILDGMQQQLNNAWTTNFIVIATGTGKKPENIKFIEKMKNLGHAWVARRMVYQLSDESARSFVVRVCSDYNVTHFVDTRKSFIKFIATEPGLADIFLHKAKPGGWKNIYRWMNKTMPQFIKPMSKAKDSSYIIRTGYTIKACP